MRRIAFISCMHVGSRVALWPESYFTPEGVEIRASPAQNVIREYFEDFWEHEAKDADTIFLLGDLCQGNNRKETGRTTTVPELEQQENACVQLLKPHIKGRTVLGVSGSKYHDSIDTSLDRAVLNALGGKFLGMLVNMKIKGTDKVLQATHGFRVPQMYKASFEDRESMLLDASIGSGQIDFNIDLVVRGHWHYYESLQMEHRTLVRVPSWQAWYPAPFMVDLYGKKQNRFGAVVVDVGKKITVHHQLYEKVMVYDKPQEL